MSTIVRAGAACALLTFATHANAHHPGGPGNAGGSGPINTLSASTLEKGRTVVGVTFEYISLGGFSDQQLADATDRAHEEGEHGHFHSMRSIVSPALGLAYGVTDDLMVSLRLPYVKRNDIREGHKHEHDEPAEVHQRGDSSGVGDITATAQYRFLNNRGTGTEAAVVLGVKAPTGETHEEDVNDEEFETEFLAGSGSWDGTFGLALTQRSGRWSFDASGMYTAIGKGQQQTDLGDRVHYGLAASYRALGGGSAVVHQHADGSGHVHAEASAGPAIDLVLELNGEWHDRQTIAGEEDPNSGGHVLYLAPGVRFSEGDWSGFVSVGVPVARDMNGEQSEPELRIVTGAGLSF
jgi:hypothetical protein